MSKVFILLECLYLKHMLCELRTHTMTNEYKSAVPFFVFHFIFYQLQFMMFFFFFSILKFDYFIRKAKQIHDKL